MKEIVMLSPAYERDEERVHSIIKDFEKGGEMIYKGRNIIKTFPLREGVVNVKRYCVPNLFNRVIYTFFRKSKGFRAFSYPEKVLEAGFETPRPIAYVEERKWGLIHYSYFVSEQCGYTRRFYEFGDADINGCKDVVRAFAAFTAGLHKAGIYHKDYSPGNILFDRIEGEWRFSIVDINRMEFGEVGIAKGCANFARLWGQPEWFRFLAEEYAGCRNVDKEECVRLVMKARNRFWRKRARNNKLGYTIRF